MISRFSTVMGTPASPPCCSHLWTRCLYMLPLNVYSGSYSGLWANVLAHLFRSWCQDLMRHDHFSLYTSAWVTMHWANSKSCQISKHLSSNGLSTYEKQPLSVWRLCAFKCCVCVLSLQHILIVQRQLSVLEEELEEFRLALRQYMECACAQTGCLQSVYILFVHLCQGFIAFIFILSIFHIFVKAWLRRADRQVLWSCPNLRLKIFQLLFWH